MDDLSTIRIVLPIADGNGTPKDCEAIIIEANVVRELRGATHFKTALSACLTQWAKEKKMEPEKLDTWGFNTLLLIHHQMQEDLLFLSFLESFGIHDFSIVRGAILDPHGWEAQDNLLDTGRLPEREFLAGAGEMFSDDFLELLNAVPIGHVFANPADNFEIYRVVAKSRMGLTVCPTNDQGLCVPNFPAKLVNYTKPQS